MTPLLKTTSSALIATLIATAAILPQAQAITIAHGGDSVDIDFVDIGNAGNEGQTYTTINTGETLTKGAVSYDYKIGTFEVLAQQYAAVSSFDANVEDNLGIPTSYVGLLPAGYTSWHEAAKFTNWLTSGDALQGVYQFSDASTLIKVDRNAALFTYGTVYALPTEDEWFKAAYFKSDGSGYTLYPTGDSVPDGIDFVGDTAYDSAYNDGANNGGVLDVGGGSVENNGTYDMGGNVWEWNESAFDGTLDDLSENRVMRGGGFGVSLEGIQSSGGRVGILPPDQEGSMTFGFRVVALEVGAVPEPSSIGLLVIGAMGCVMRRKRG